MISPIVVKLGGSLAFSDRLKAWIAAILSARPPVVLVAGGGPFADGVRAAQDRLGFTDEAAHVMALHAMSQFAWALSGLDDRFVPAGGPDEIGRAFRDGRTPVWDPVPMIAGDFDLPRSWTVTSDSLAVRLAGRLSARALVFIKQAEVPEQARTIRALAEAGVVDLMTPSLLAATGVDAWLAGPAHSAMLATALADGRPAAWRIAV